jgi:serine/threonine protein kinase
MFTLKERISNEKQFSIDTLDASKKKFLGKGGFGAAYKVDDMTVLKTLTLTEMRNYPIKEHFKHLDTLAYNENPWRELHIHKLVNNLLKKKYTQNAVMFYAYDHDMEKQQLSLYRELYDMSLQDLLIDISKQLGKKTKNKDELNTTIMSILFQTLHGFMVLQKKLGFFQGDPGPRNVLIKKIEPGGFWKYIINGKDFFVPNCGYIACIADFGQSVIRDFTLADFELEYYPSSVTELEHDKEPLDILDLALNLLAQHRMLFVSTLANFMYTNVVYQRWFNVYNIVGSKVPLTCEDIICQLFGDYNLAKQSDIIETFKV